MGACTRKCNLGERTLLRHSILQLGAYVNSSRYLYFDVLLHHLHGRVYHLAQRPLRNQDS